MLILNCALFLGIILHGNFASKPAASLLPFIKFFWTQINFDFQNQNVKELTDRGTFIPANNVPFGVEVWRNKLFVTIPRRRPGIPATLNYVDTGIIKKSPLLKPYPNIETNQLDGGTLTSIYRMNIDICDRLWFVDTGLAASNNGSNVQYQPAKLKIYNLQTDTLIREYILQQDSRPDSSLTNLIVDVSNSCEDAFAYITDLGAFGLIVYSLKQNNSWRIRHPFFYPDPLSSDYNIGGINFQWQDGVFGVALSAVKNDNYRILYFHPLSTTNEFSVSTRYLQDRTLANSSYHSYNVLGNRGPLSQASASSLHEKSGVLFYPIVNKNAIGCWNENKFHNEYSTATNGIIFKDDSLLIYASDLKVDKEDNLWFISNRLPIAVFSSLNFQEPNFHIFKIPIKDAIENSVCDPNRPKHTHSTHSWDAAQY